MKSNNIVNTFLKFCNYNVILFLCLCVGCRSVRDVDSTGECYDSQVRVGEIVWDNNPADGRLMYGRIHPDDVVFIENRERLLDTDDGLFEIPTTDDGRFVLGVEQDKKQLALVLQSQGEFRDVVINISARQWVEDVVNGLPPDKVRPPVAVQERIFNEFQAIKEKRKQSVFNEFPSSWSEPVSAYRRISSPFGAKRILNGVVQNCHSGVDYAADMGTPVVSVGRGVVVLTHPDMYYSGATVLIDHGYGVYSSYSHLNTIEVTEGMIIKQGGKIGTVGNSGRSTGPHLHFGLSWYNVRLDGAELFQK